MEDLSGRQLGAYRIVSQIGEGGMAAVFRAYQPGVDRYVALKILPRQLGADPTFLGRFQQEAKVLAQLQHPHILPVFDFGEDDGYTYIVMPFVESGTLADLLQGRPLEMSQIRTIISQVGDALDYAHERGLVHRDIKPSNILVDARGNCLLTDFGIAKIFAATARYTTTGSLIGTPAYMSPEQGRGGLVDGRSDIYSLGIILYEMATGRVPFQAETPIAVIYKHAQEPLPLPRTLNPQLSEAVETVILKALAKQPEDRFPTASAMAQALHNAAGAKGVGAGAFPASKMRTARPFSLRLLLVLALILIIGGIGLWAILGGVEEGQESSVAPTTTPKQAAVAIEVETLLPTATMFPTLTPAPTALPSPTLFPTLTSLPAATNTPTSTPTSTPPPERIVFNTAEIIHLGDEEFQDWPPLTGTCYDIDFSLPDPVTALTLEVEALRSEVELPILLNGQRVTQLPPTGERFGVVWVEQSTAIPLNGLRAGSNRLSICSQAIVDNPDFPGDIDDLQLTNIVLTARQ